MLMIPAAGMAALAVAVPAAAKKKPAPPAGPAPAPTCASADAAAGSLTSSQLAAALLCVLNQERGSRGLAALKADAQLGKAAQGYATSVAPPRKLTDRGRDGSTPQSRATAAGYPRTALVGEILGRSKGTSATATARVRDWLAIGATRKLVLGKRWQEAGIGTTTADATTIFVVNLGARAKAKQ
jgi:uncharacterized protein YkwD